MSNLLINTETMEVKPIDFGVGDLLKSLLYITFSGMHRMLLFYLRLLEERPGAALEFIWMLSHDWFKVSLKQAKMICLFFCLFVDLI